MQKTMYTSFLKKETVFNAIAIFISILGSFAVERYIQFNKEQAELEILENNLLYELEQNYFSLLSLRGSLKSVIAVSDSTTSNWIGISSQKVKKYHQDNLYDINERIEFILSNSYGFSAKNMYFNSLKNSGLILKIERKELRNEIEVVGSLINRNYYSSNQKISEGIRSWFHEKALIEESLNFDLIFDKHKDFELLKLLSDRRRNEIYKLYGVENDIEFLERLIDDIKTKGMF